MSTANAKSSRPLSPHLSIWKWGPHMLVSILHRVSGDGLAVVGLGLLLWFVGALAAGPDAWATFTAAMGHPLGLIVLIGISWAFFNHMSSGIRHLVLDTGAGYELDTNRAWSIISVLMGLLLTAAFWAAIFLL